MTVILNNKVRTWIIKLVIGFSMGHRHGSISQKQDRLFRTTMLSLVIVCFNVLLRTALCIFASCWRTLTLARHLAIGLFRLLLDVEPVASCAANKVE